MTTNAAGPAALIADTDSPAPSTRPARRRRRPRIVTNLIAVVFAVVWIFPVYWMLNTAFKPRSDIMSTTPQFVPVHPTLVNFIDAITHQGFFSSLANSLIVVIVTLIVATAVSFFAAAALSRYRFRFRRTFMVVILAVQMLPATALLIPQFLVFNDLNLLNSYFGLILAYVAAVLPFSIWTLRGFFIVIPVEVEEAAMMDGAGTWRILRSVLFPLIVPGLISTSIFGFITAWNEFILAYTFMKSQSMYTLPIWLSSFSKPILGTDYGGLMAASVLFALPVVVFFLIIQRNLVTGMSAGAVKG